MGFGEKLKNFIAPLEDEEEMNLSESETDTLTQYEEAQEIASHIKQKRACAINLHRMPNEYRQRIIDFLSGVIFALEGSINKVGDNVILCSPKTMPVGGEISLNDSER